MKLTRILCAKHGRPPEEHSSSSLVACFEFGTCPTCRGAGLSDGRALCDRCGAYGRVVVAAIKGTESDEQQSRSE